MSMCLKVSMTKINLMWGALKHRTHDQVCLQQLDMPKELMQWNINMTWTTTWKVKEQKIVLYLMYKQSEIFTVKYVKCHQYVPAKSNIRYLQYIAVVNTVNSFITLHFKTFQLIYWKWPEYHIPVIDVITLSQILCAFKCKQYSTAVTHPHHKHIY